MDGNLCRRISILNHRHACNLRCLKAYLFRHIAWTFTHCSEDFPRSIYFEIITSFKALLIRHAYGDVESVIE